MHDSGYLNWTARQAATLVLLLLATAGVSAGAAEDHAWVASTSIRVVDLERGVVVGTVDVAEQQVVREIVFDRRGDSAYVASMGGLFQVNTATLDVQRCLSDRPTAALAIDRSNGRLAALHLAYPGDNLARRDLGLPIVTTLQVYGLPDGEPVVSAPIYGFPLRVRFSADGQRLFVMDAQDGVLSVLDAAAVPVGAIDVLEDHGDGAQCTALERGPDDSLAAVCNTPSGSAVVEIRGAGVPSTAQVRVRSLGDHRGGRALSYMPDGSMVVMFLGQLALLKDEGKPQWTAMEHPYSLVRVTSGGGRVFATPSYSTGDGSGALMIDDGDGQPLRIVELPDMSPYTLAIQP